MIEAKASGESVRTIEGLRYRRELVETLPMDPVVDRRTRQVMGACASRVAPTAVRAPELVALVPEVAALLDLSTEETGGLAEVLGGNRVVAGMDPYAACYGGHQFGNWAGQLGDGRAITLGEVENERGEVWEVQLKGAGPTPYSRRADGRAVLRSSLRELVCSEAMHHLGVPTTRALSLVLTGEEVERDMFYDGNPGLEPGAVVARVAPSFLRFGSYEIHAARRDHETLRRLVNYTTRRLYPRLWDGEKSDVVGLFDEVSRRTVRLVVEWMRVGFVHGVMNTDNMSMLGLTIDYGPYGWLESFDPRWTPNTTDASGRRYCFGHQPRMAFWNLARLAEALLPLVEGPEALTEVLHGHASSFPGQHRGMMLGKLGLSEGTDAVEADALIDGLYGVFGAIEADMTLFFRRLSARAETPASRAEHLKGAFYDPDAIDASASKRLMAWLERYEEQVQRTGFEQEERRSRMDAINPLYVPRNYLVHRTIERVQGGERGALAELLDVLRRPYEEQPGRESFCGKRPDWARHQPGCSMLSCSS